MVRHQLDGSKADLDHRLDDVVYTGQAAEAEGLHPDVHSLDCRINPVTGRLPHHHGEWDGGERQPAELPARVDVRGRIVEDHRELPSSSAGICPTPCAAGAECRNHRPDQVGYQSKARRRRPAAASGKPLASPCRICVELDFEKRVPHELVASVAVG
jgi:hypothetical protein